MIEPASEPPRRFPFHVSTFVILAFVAAGLIWNNLSRWSTGYESGFGWPFRIYRDWSDFGGSRNTEFFSDGLISNLIFDAIILAIALPVIERVGRSYHKYFRFHLSTVVVVTLAAGVLMFLNLRVVEYQRCNALFNHYRGWPYPAYIHSNMEYCSTEPEWTPVPNIFSEVDDLTIRGQILRVALYRYAVIDALTALLILVLVFVAAEWVARKFQRYGGIEPCAKSY